VAIEPSETIYTSNQEVHEITSSDYVTLVVLLAGGSLDHRVVWIVAADVVRPHEAHPRLQACI